MPTLRQATGRRADLTDLFTEAAEAGLLDDPAPGTGGTICCDMSDTTIVLTDATTTHELSASGLGTEDGPNASEPTAAQREVRQAIIDLRSRLETLTQESDEYTPTDPQRLRRLANVEGVCRRVARLRPRTARPTGDGLTWLRRRLMAADGFVPARTDSAVVTRSMARRAGLLDDRDLARRFAAGDISALREVYARYAGPVYTVALSRLSDRHLAEEAVQDVFLKAWRAAASFDVERPFSPWLYEIARRSAADIARRERRRPATASLPRALPDDDVVTLGDPWEAWEVRCALRDLPSDERELVRLTHYVGLTQWQIAEQLGIPLGTVKSRVHRAHRRLAERLAHLKA